MAKKKSGYSMSENIRVGKTDKTDLKLLMKVLKKKKQGHVIHELIGMWKNKQIGHYSSPLKEQQVVEQSVYDDLERTNRVLKKTVDLLCEKQGIKFAEAMELVKCQV